MPMVTRREEENKGGRGDRIAEKERVSLRGLCTPASGREDDEATTHLKLAPLVHRALRSRNHAVPY